MKVSRDLKELIRRKLEKVKKSLIKKEEEKIIKNVTKELENIKKLTEEIYKLQNLRTDKKYNLKKKLLKGEDDYLYINDEGTVNVGNLVDVKFDIEEHLFCFIERIELSNDKEGILQTILNEIKEMEVK